MLSQQTSPALSEAKEYQHQWLGLGNVMLRRACEGSYSEFSVYVLLRCSVCRCLVHFFLRALILEIRWMARLLGLLCHFHSTSLA